MYKRAKQLQALSYLHKKKALILFVITLILVIFAGISWRSFFKDNSKWIPKEGGIFTESIVGEIKNISPFASNPSLFDLDLRQLLFTGLLQHNPTTGGIEDGLATLRVSENGKTYFLTLKNSAKFSNGESISTDDVIFTYEEVIQNPNFSNKALKNAFEYITLDVIDKQTVSFNLHEPNTYFSSLLTTPILRKKSYENALIEEINDPDFPANKSPINTGPYVLKNIIPDKIGVIRVFLERNNHYFAGKPYIKKFVFYLYPDFNYLKYDNQWTSMNSRLSEVQVNDFEKDLYEEYSRREYFLPRFTGMFFNLDAKFTANPNLREALKMSIDKDSIINKESGWNRVDSPFFFDSIESWQEKDFIGARKILRDHRFKYNKSKEIQTYDDEEVRIKMITSTSPSVYSRLAQNIARIWEKELSIVIDLDVLKPDEFQKALKERNYDIVFFGQNFSENPDSLSTWHSSQSGNLNISNLTNKDIDFLIEEVRFTGAQSDLLTLNQKLEEINPVIALATPRYYLLVSHNLLGFSKNFGKIRKHAERFFGIENWHFKQKKDWDLDQNKSKISQYFSWLFSDKKNEELDYREKMPEEENNSKNE